MDEQLTARQLSIHGYSRVSDWMPFDPDANQLRIREEMLESGSCFSGSWISASVVRTI